MSSINSVGGNSPISRIISSPIQKSIPTHAPSQLPATDKLALSGLSGMLKLAKEGDVRIDKVTQIKAAIADGSYDDDHKLAVATDKLLDDLNK